LRAVDLPADIAPLHFSRTWDWFTRRFFSPIYPPQSIRASTIRTYSHGLGVHGHSLDPIRKANLLGWPKRSHQLPAREAPFNTWVRMPEAAMASADFLLRGPRALA
jgi:hypothetical protein